MFQLDNLMKTIRHSKLADLKGCFCALVFFAFGLSNTIIIKFDPRPSFEAYSFQSNSSNQVFICEIISLPEISLTPLPPSIGFSHLLQVRHNCSIVSLPCKQLLSVYVYHKNLQDFEKIWGRKDRGYEQFMYFRLLNNKRIKFIHNRFYVLCI